MTTQTNENPVVAVTINAELFNAIAQYLSKRPWEEVNPLLSGLQQGEPVFGEPSVNDTVADDEPAPKAKTKR